MKRRNVILLPDDLANKIAAGEVVTRPSSAAKELIDNAIDARARRVEVEIEGGGSRLIRVVDDGHGMTLADARLALVRHATSKIRHASDLDCIHTMGFRGEALPSIAAVSKLTLRTRVDEEDAGWELRVDGGSDIDERPCGCPVGTSVEISDLFFNVPVRRKFLRAVSTESAHTSAAVRAAALAHPDIAWVFRRDGRLGYRYSATESRAERVAEVLRARSLWFCSASRGPMHIEAYLSSPERARMGAGGLHLFVNRRPIVDRGIIRAISSAYGDSLPRGRYPLGAVFITMPPELLDVNVHPQKTEVR
ncbi:MAG TPA: DNA mismatch repair endonuclease MutL, partial [Sorangium sp.]|nr:DNA mismatch repair endonuclease MutL [Sorangium sp.]